MSRSGYSDDYDDNLEIGRWRGIVASAIRGKRGQKFFRDLIVALEEMPEKRLIKNDLHNSGDVCAIGALGLKRGINMDSMDPYDHEMIAANFDIAAQLAQEVFYENDEGNYQENSEERWARMHQWATKQLLDKE